MRIIGIAPWRQIVRTFVTGNPMSSRPPCPHGSENTTPASSRPVIDSKRSIVSSVTVSSSLVGLK